MADELAGLFRELVDLSEAERELRMQELSVPEEIRQQLRELIQHDQTEDAPWGQAIQSLAADALQGDHWIGAIAGAYRLDRLLGHGGMGAVYLGERTDGTVSHRAAIKLIHSSAPELVERFLRERQILASLSHPNIAQLLDAGTMAGGVPYLAMEYCDGQAIDQYCESHELDTAGVLRLILPACAAVHYAHQRMIVHRDLKPSNIFITSDGVPKLLDFGIAKILDDPAIEVTRTEARMMTLQFASPEQIRGELVSAASDVYSIGAVLYRLLTGHYIHQTGTGRLAHVELNADPKRPREWRPDLPRDVENILLTALRREPEARYSSAEALADDIRRFLEHRPVKATPPSLTYRAARFVQRNPAAAVASALAMVSMLAGTTFSIYQARQAKKNLSDVRQMANVMLFDFERSIRDLPGTLEARHRVVTTARTYLEKIAPQAGNDPALQREVADAYRSLADVEYSSRLSRQGAEAAVESLQASLNIRRRLNDATSKDPRRLLPYVEVAAGLCSRSTFVGKMDVAKEACGEAMALAREWLEREPQGREAMMSAQAAMLQNGTMLEADGQAGEARQSLEKAFGYASELARREPDNADFRLRLSRSGRAYGELLLTLKEPLAAIGPGETAVNAIVPLLSVNPRNIAWRVESSGAYLAAGSAHRQAAMAHIEPKVHLARAAALLEKALALNLETAQMDPVSGSAQDALIVTLHRLARVRENQQRYDEALRLYADARAIIQKRLTGDATRRNLYLMGNNLLSAAETHLMARQRREAAAAFEESSGWLRKTLAKEPTDAVAQENLISVYLGQAKMAEEDHATDRARDRWLLAWDEAQKLIQRDATAKKYMSDYPSLESMGRRLGELPAAR